MTEPHGARLPRAQRREQILSAATRAFARTGFAGTSLDDVAREAGISRMIVYRHFDSKAELYLSALERVGERLREATYSPEYTMDSLRGLLRAAGEDPDGFRLLFRHAVREPEFRERTEQARTRMSEVALTAVAGEISDPLWARWAAGFLPVAVIEAVLAWLDTGQPDPGGMADRIATVTAGVIAAARPVPRGTMWFDCSDEGDQR
ncbi:TetR/AcrR family transcriptional regulator [Kutzneria albida]|uniref:HTH tetR-type domain-containing protein n=1 Tax=Kutzneria albida DSM 43870 TaxID=1449976 RepID=W5W2S8_9PSEU|nr:TetR/AcrR family transcriptional regulator [Kutzneria albida]AHH94806.1 hypothetical protein KALB_1433 [Kutzneria albida DSM 43870]